MTIGQRRFYELTPEVAGGWGTNTVADTAVYPPAVSYLEYCFDGWLGDPLIESFPCFIVTEQVHKAMLEIGVTGARFEEMAVCKSKIFHDLMPGKELPNFSRLLIVGQPRADDLWINDSQKLIVSQRLLNLLVRFGLSHADPIEVTKFS